MTRRSHLQTSIAGAGLMGVAAILIGAFGAHWLESSLADRFDDPTLLAKRIHQFDVAARYHLIHAVAIAAVAALPIAAATRRWITLGFALGILIFSGSLYLLVVLEQPWLGAVTPIGGGIWIVAWAMLAWTGWNLDPVNDSDKSVNDADKVAP